MMERLGRLGLNFLAYVFEEVQIRKVNSTRQGGLEAAVFIGRLFKLTYQGEGEKQHKLLHGKCHDPFQLQTSFLLAYPYFWPKTPGCPFHTFHLFKLLCHFMLSLLNLRRGWASKIQKLHSLYTLSRKRKLIERVNDMEKSQGLQRSPKVLLPQGQRAIKYTANVRP